MDLWQAAQLPELISKLWARPARVVDRGLCRATAAAAVVKKRREASEPDLVYNVVLIVISIGLAVAAVRFVLSGLGIGEIGRRCVARSGNTCGRVVLLIALQHHSPGRQSGSPSASARS